MSTAPTESQLRPLPPVKGPVLRDIMREHLEEIGTLRMQRLALRFRDDSTERALLRIDRRIAAHRDGLAEGAPASVEVAEEMLEKAFDPWEVAAIVETLFALGSPESSFVEDRLVKGPVDLLGGWFEGLRATPAARISPLASLVPGLSDLGPRIAPLIGALGWHGLLDKPLAMRALAHEDPKVRHALARAVGWSAPRDCDAGLLLERLGSDPDIGVRRRAAWSAMVRSTASGIGIVRDLARSSSDPFALRVLELVEGRKAAEGAPPEEVEAADLDRRMLRDAASAAPDEVSNLLLWRVAAGSGRSDLAPLLREVPGSFFEDSFGEEVSPGP